MFLNPERNGNMSTIDLHHIHMDEILKSLTLFEPITLEEMDHVRLLDRLDTKFIFRKDLLPSFLAQLKDDYCILEINGLRIGRYETRYFDTDDFMFYLHHHNGKLNRYKIRFRKYVDSDTTFFEVKLKNSKGRMIKKRVQVDGFDEIIRGTAEEFLQKTTKLPSAIFHPSLNVFYSRMTFVNRNSHERLTIDTGLNYSNLRDKITYPNLVIAETKQAKSGSSPFLSLMQKNHIREITVSKYCLGIANLVNGIKKNNFKYRLYQINKTDHGSK
jgi:hypothetical protein